MKREARWRVRLAAVILIWFLTVISLSARAKAQSLSFGACKPVSERTTPVGCWILVNQPIGRIDQGQVFWHLDVYATRAEADKAKRTAWRRQLSRFIS